MIAEAGELGILYADSSLLVVEKPGGLLAVPGRGPEKQDCMASRVKAHFSDCIEQPAVHRLDMDTSGLMVFAFTAEAHRNLSRQFAERQVKKRYVAVLKGQVAGDSGEITLRFRLDPDNRPHQVYDPERGKLGISRWQKLSSDRERTRIEFTPLTGRTHQLRVHAAHELGLGCPIVGDRLYGNGRPGDRLLLHAELLRFRHPLTGDVMEYSSPVPF